MARRTNKSVPKKVTSQVSQQITAAGGSTIRNIQQISGDYHEHHHYRTGTIGVPFMAPPLPPYFVPRPEIENDLKKNLLSKSSNLPGVLVVSAIHGIGGIGKSIIATALVHDTQIQRHFKDGILWTTLGQRPDILAILSSWIQNLGNYDARPASIESASSILRSLIFNKKMVLVIDDAWEPSHVIPFLVAGASSRVLITTRRSDVGDGVGADIHYVDALTADQSIELLESRVRRKFTDTEKESALAFSQEVGYLPLALNLAATRVVRGATWKELNNAIHNEVALLEVLESRHDYRKGNLVLEASYHLSLNYLREEDEAAWKAFIWLGILPEDVTITERMSSTLWKVDFDQAKDLLEILSSDGLLLPGVAVYINGTAYKGFRVHDILHDIARRLIIKHPPDGLGISLVEAHQSLLSKYRETITHGSWFNLPDDGYIHSYLAWHMESANKIDELHRLLREETPEHINGWYAAKETLGQTAGYFDDINRAWSHSETLGKLELENPITNTFRYALINSSLVSLAQQIQPALLSALVKKEIWTPSQAIAYAFQVRAEDQLAEAIEELSPLLSSPLINQCSIVANRISSQGNRDRALSAISAALLKTDLEASTNLIELIRIAEFREQSLVKMVEFLYEDGSIETAKRLCKRISKPKYQVEVLIVELAICDQQRFQVINEQISSALSSFRLPSEEHIELCVKWVSKLASIGKTQSALLIAKEKIKDPFTSCSAYIEILPHVKSNQEKTHIIQDALDIVNNVSGRYAKATLKAKLIPYLRHGKRKLAETLLQEIRPWAGLYAPALATMSASFPPKIRNENFVKALDAVKEINFSYARARSLAGLAGYLSKEKVQEIFLGMQKIADDQIVCDAVIKLLPYLSDEPLDSAIALLKANKTSFSIDKLVEALPRETSLNIVRIVLSMIKPVTNETAKVNMILTLLSKVSTTDRIAEKPFVNAIKSIKDRQTYDTLADKIKLKFSDTVVDSQSKKEIWPPEKVLSSKTGLTIENQDITVLALDALINLFNRELTPRNLMSNFLLQSIAELEDNSWKVRLLLRFLSVVTDSTKTRLVPIIVDNINDISAETEKALYMSFLVVSLNLHDIQSELINKLIKMQKLDHFEEWMYILSQISPVSSVDQQKVITEQKNELTKSIRLKQHSSKDEKLRFARQWETLKLSPQLSNQQSKLRMLALENSLEEQDVRVKKIDIFESFDELLQEFTPKVEQTLNEEASYDIGLSEDYSAPGIYPKRNSIKDPAIILAIVLEWWENIPPELGGDVISKILFSYLTSDRGISEESMKPLAGKLSPEISAKTLSYIFSLKSKRNRFEKGMRLLPFLSGIYKKELLAKLSTWVWDEKAYLETDALARSLSELSDYFSKDELKALCPKVLQFLAINTTTVLKNIPRLLPYLSFASKQEIHQLYVQFCRTFGYETRIALLANLEIVISLCELLDVEFADLFFKSIQDVYNWWQ